MNKELLAKIKKIRILTKRFSRTSLVGDYASAFRGMGIEFNQLREYVPGDDIRFIDWNSSLKTDNLMIKQFIEERERSVILMVDISKSMFCSSKSSLKKDLAFEVAAALSFIALDSKDKVGLLLFSDRVEKWVPPSRSRSQTYKIIETLTSTKPKGTETKIEEAIKFLINLKQRNSIVFTLSDWIEDHSNYYKLLGIAKVKHDFIAVRFLDEIEREFPFIGLLEIEDPETKEKLIINTGATSLTKFNPLNLFLKERLIKQKDFFRKNKIDILDIKSEDTLLWSLVNFFHQRSRRSI